MQNDSNHWFTAKQAAAYIGVHVETLYLYVRRKRNRPPVRRFGGERSPYRFPKEDFIEWANGPKKKG
jgi:excisionase family DNA binding protein